VLFDLSTVRFTGLGTFLIVKALRARDSEGTFVWVFESNFHLLLPVQPLKGRGNPVKCLVQGARTQQANLLAYLRTKPLK